MHLPTIIKSLALIVIASHIADLGRALASFTFPAVIKWMDCSVARRSRQGLRSHILAFIKTCFTLRGTSHTGNTWTKIMLSLRKTSSQAIAHLTLPPSFSLCFLQGSVLWGLHGEGEKNRQAFCYEVCEEEKQKGHQPGEWNRRVADVRMKQL